MPTEKVTTECSEANDIINALRAAAKSVKKLGDELVDREETRQSYVDAISDRDHARELVRELREVDDHYRIVLLVAEDMLRGIADLDDLRRVMADVVGPPEGIVT